MERAGTLELKSPLVLKNERWDRFPGGEFVNTENGGVLHQVKRMISSGFLSSLQYTPKVSLHPARCGRARAPVYEPLLVARRSRVKGTAPILAVQDEWLQKLPDKKKPLYSHSLPCTEAWLRSLGFVQTTEDRAAWTIQRSDWHARLSLDLTELFIRYMKSGPGNLDRDVERKFSYALSREDLENAILGGP